MSRLTSLFARKHSHILNVYGTAGYPALNSTMPMMRSLQSNGADIIELGMPYSDPLADGPVIQNSNMIALDNGMNLSLLFEQLRNMRAEIHVPVILMGYMNPVLQYGFEHFCKDAAAVGVDGLILPDMPDQAFEQYYGAIVRRYGLDFIFLVTPQTSDERIRKLDALSSGFVYAVSSAATTGSDKSMSHLNNYLRRLSDMQLKNPVMVGFGISTRAHVEQVCTYANGAIIGSAYIRALEHTNDIEKATADFLQQIVPSSSGISEDI